MEDSSTRERILEVALHLAQRRGFNAFSYADIADAVGVRKASVHHHFSSKDDLEVELLRRYNAQFCDALLRLEHSQPKAGDRLRAYGLLYRATLEQGGVCLCGITAAEIASLPEAVRVPLVSFFRSQVNWLTEVLKAGRRTHQLEFAGPPARRAQSILASLQGGLLVAHAMRDVALFDVVLDDVLKAAGCG